MMKEYSKQLTFWILVFCGVAAIAIIVGWYLGLPRAVEMLAVIGIIAGLAARYYFNKARDENLEKIKRNGVFSKDEMAMLIKIRENGNDDLTTALSKIVSTTTSEIGG